ncbi:hypothetical protein BVRB_7g177720 [Beta vulgaris subsp. vulgaris]|uniref:NB-ARC domain-containing protein n=1 Tax=Beta vulgaris subsp. vulgaris TaxID=3555 RepID=A0A0J8E283_BETVV|nr:hypothetical protein BVRB_7g177720 [Beta vulgaris subsp. vulgaris]
MEFIILAMLPGRHCLGDRQRILQNKTDYLSARIKDIEGEISPTLAQRGTKRKPDDELSHWSVEGQELVGKAKYVLSQVGGGWRDFFKGVKMRWDVDRIVDALDVHDKKGDVLFKQAMSDAQGPCHGYHIPVKALVGQVASTTLRRLEVLLLEDDKVGRIAIHGVEGVGKTFLMKHLYNSALKWVHKFDHVFWITFPDQFSIKRLQDAIAAAVKCDLACDDDLDLRARKLSETLEDLVSFVLFLDDVTGDEFTLDQVGIPVPAEGSKYKVVLTTSSTLERSLLDSFEVVVVDPLEEEEAFELFMLEARIDLAFAASLGDTPRLLAERCCRMPRLIVDVATRMCGIDDPHEWRYALYESMCLGDSQIDGVYHQLDW